MAKMIQAYQAYSPRVKIQRMVEVDEVVRYISDRTGLNRSELLFALMEMHDCLYNYLRTGYSVRLPGLGSFAPAVDKNGSFSINHRPDKELTANLNNPNEYLGSIRNKDMIGKTEEDYIERWNEEHPDDKIKKK